MEGGSVGGGGSGDFGEPVNGGSGARSFGPFSTLSRSPNVLKPAMRASRLASPLTNSPVPGLAVSIESVSVESSVKFVKTP